MADRRAWFAPGEIWPDDKGVHINAHGGGILFHEGVYDWFGEHKIAGKAGKLAHVGVHCYSSRDLYNWEDEGIALAVSDDPRSDIAVECILERPKVIYNEKTDNFVMRFHLELKGQGYKTARARIAVAKRPTGPYTYVHSIRPNKGCWPINATTAHRAAIHDAALMAEMSAREFSCAANPDTPRYPLLARDFARGQASRDMTLFLGDDGRACHVCASEENSTLHISLLGDDFLAPSGKYARAVGNRWHEAPALCKCRGQYWLIASDCTGGAPNAARSAVADSIWARGRNSATPPKGSIRRTVWGRRRRSAGRARSSFRSAEKGRRSLRCSTCGDHRMR
jgi:hypothetical protein